MPIELKICGINSENIIQIIMQMAPHPKAFGQLEQLAHGETILKFPFVQILLPMRN